jgi:hypothetical protein
LRQSIRASAALSKRQCVMSPFDADQQMHAMCQIPRIRGSAKNGNPLRKQALSRFISRPNGCAAVPIRAHQK